MKPLDNEDAAKLLMQPAVAAASLSAYGVGLAAQGFGVWLSAMTTSMRTMQALMHAQVPAGGTAADEASLPAARSTKPPRQRARKAVETIMADAVAVAQDTAAPAPAAGLLPEDWQRPASMKKPRRPDDLKAIGGIGPKLEQVLNGLGVWTYAQIAAWGDEQVAWVDDYLSFRGRIGRDGWIEQASRLKGMSR